tara:strand:- start:448 stop:1089 length:642 start_codon:yes stop_codon:yes gene_type:complete
MTEAHDENESVYTQSKSNGSDSTPEIDWADEDYTYQHPRVLFEALAMARMEMTSPRLDGTNPHYRSRYVTLQSLLDTIYPILSQHGLHLLQVPEGDTLLTVLMHAGGEKLEYRSPLPPLSDIQKFSAAVTYMRRISLSAILGIAGEDDDDGNSAETVGRITPEQIATLTALAEDVGADMAGFLRFCRVESLDEMLTSKYAAATKALEAKRDNA